MVNLLKLKQAAGILEVADIEAVNHALVVDADAALDDAGAQSDTEIKTEAETKPAKTYRNK